MTQELGINLKIEFDSINLVTTVLMYVQIYAAYMTMAVTRALSEATSAGFVSMSNTE